MVGESEIDGEEVVVGSVVAGHSAYGMIKHERVTTSPELLQ